MTPIAVKHLAYSYEALSSAISAETLKFHHDKHYVGYLTKLNDLIEDTPFVDMNIEEIIQRSSGVIFNNAAQTLNHELYFEQFSHSPQREPKGRLLDAISAKFGTVERLKEMMHQSAMSLFGSGWVWLASDDSGALFIINESNAGNPIIHGLTPLLTIDVWEHAYYIDYRNDRAEAVRQLWNIIDWSVIERRYE